MPRCPNCGYILVLLEKRRKYKCAKCSNLYPQTFIDNEEFRNWNKLQKELDKQNLRRKRPKLTEEQKRERRNEYAKLWKSAHKEKVNPRNRELYQINKEHIGTLHKELRLKDMGRTRTLWKIGFWRDQQKKLAVKRLNDSFPTL